MTISGIENDKTSVSLTINTNGRCVIPQTLKSGESCFIGLKADSTLDSGAGDAIKAYSNLTTVAFSGASPADLTATTTVNTLSYITTDGLVSIEEPSDVSTVANSGTMTLKNLGPFKFKPSTVLADYAITGADTTGQVINTNSSVSTCLSGTELDVNGTCDIVLNVTSGAVTGDYATVYNSGASSNTNLAADPTVDTYSFTDQDAYIAWFKDDASVSANRITDLTANIQMLSGVAQTFVIKNIGENL